MNAVLAFLSYIMSLFGAAPADQAIPTLPGINNIETAAEGTHIVNTNPRTVVALEDTHFRPNR